MSGVRRCCCLVRRAVCVGGGGVVVSSGASRTKRTESGFTFRAVNKGTVCSETACSETRGDSAHEMRGDTDTRANHSPSIPYPWCTVSPWQDERERSCGNLPFVRSCTSQRLKCTRVIS